MVIGSGETLDRFKLEERLGKGRLGEVWRAIDTRIGRQVAIKLVPRDEAWDLDPSTTLKLDHANCV